jgi:hypothetical protein
VPDDLERMQRTRRFAGRVMRSTPPGLFGHDGERRCAASPLARSEIAIRAARGPGGRTRPGASRRVQKEGTSVYISARRDGATRASMGYDTAFR